MKKKKIMREESAAKATEATEKSIQNPHPFFSYSPPKTTGEVHPSHLLIIDILSSNPSKLASFISSIRSHFSLDDSRKVSVSQLSNVSKVDNNGVQSDLKDSMKIGNPRRKKEKRVKKRQNSLKAEYGFLQSQESLTQDKNDLDCLYPLTSLSIVRQKKIEQQNDQLDKAHDSQALTLANVLLANVQSATT